MRARIKLYGPLYIEACARGGKKKFIAAMAECARVVSLHRGLLIRFGHAQALLNRATSESTVILNILAELVNFRAGLLNAIDSIEHLDFGPTQE
jgi:hypothetical protein